MTAEFDSSRPTGGARSGLSLRAKGVAIISLPIVALFVAMFSVRWMGVESVSAEQAIEREYRNHFAQLGLPFDRAEELRLAELLGRRDSARRKLSGILVCCGILGPLGALFMHLLLAGRWCGACGRWRKMRAGWPTACRWNRFRRGPTKSPRWRANWRTPPICCANANAN